MDPVSDAGIRVLAATYKIDADDELRFAALIALDLGALVVGRPADSLGRVAVALSLWGHRVVAWQGRLRVHLLLVLGRVGVAGGASVDGRWWHGTGRPAAGGGVLRGEVGVAGLVGVLVRRRAAERLLTVHGERGSRGGGLLSGRQRRRSGRRGRVGGRRGACGIAAGGGRGGRGRGRVDGEGGGRGVAGSGRLARGPARGRRAD